MHLVDRQPHAPAPARFPSILFAAVLIALASTAPMFADVVVSLNPKATFIKVNSDSALASTPLVLASLGIAPGDRIEIGLTGDFDFGPGGDDGRSMIGIFSSSPTLLGPSVVQRVPDAIDAGVDVFTSPTFNGGLRTDVSQDFRISTAAIPADSICIIVPAGATHLFLCSPDTLYQDNSDPDGDWGATIELLAPCAADLDGNGNVNAADLAVLLGGWGSTGVVGTPGDLDCNGSVDASDLAVLLGAWGSCG
jgi:hypothetical protein